MASVTLSAGTTQTDDFGMRLQGGPPKIRPFVGSGGGDIEAGTITGGVTKSRPSPLALLSRQRPSEPKLCSDLPLAMEPNSPPVEPKSSFRLKVLPLPDGLTFEDMEEYGVVARGVDEDIDFSSSWTISMPKRLVLEAWLDVMEAAEER